ncbi:hypothetical protein HJC23_012171 [Cyclotella cryptica]|uniref:Uncharacterized protein n=1 Tax=Cyclotella cryptica TaxID=29204 RepID=A0ABD3PB14_9STRA
MIHSANADASHDSCKPAHNEVLAMHARDALPEGDIFDTCVAVPGMTRAVASSLDLPPKTIVNSTCTAKKNLEPECSIYIRGLIGPPITDIQRKELYEWTEEIFRSALSSNTIKPSPRLMTLLGKPAHEKDIHWVEIMCPVLNQALDSLATDLDVDGEARDHFGLNSISATSDSPLEYFVLDSHPIPAAVLYLYYVALECILHSHRTGNRNMLVLNPQFHKSLFSLCHLCLRKATDHGQSFFTIHNTGSCPIVYYKLVEAFLQEMTLPSFLKQVFRHIQEMIVDSLWLVNFDDCINNNTNNNLGSSFVSMINKLRERPSNWPLACLRQICPIKLMNCASNDAPAKECMFVSYMVQKLLAVIERRLKELCAILSLPNIDTVGEKSLMVFTSLMCYRIDIFFNRHPDQIMLCTLYAVCTKMKLAPHTNFRTIVHAYVQKNSSYLSHSVVHNILYSISNCSEGGGVGDILSLYNVSDYSISKLLFRDSETNFKRIYFSAHFN